MAVTQAELQLLREKWQALDQAANVASRASRVGSGGLSPMGPLTRQLASTARRKYLEAQRAYTAQKRAQG